MNKKNVCIQKWNKYFKLDKKYFEEFSKYTSTKLKYSWFKKILMGFFGGIFVSLGYTAYLLVAGANSTMDPILLKFLGSLLFPIALLLCIYFGGSLFTSSSMGVISVLYKEHRTKHYVTDLVLTLLGNTMGTFIFALIVWGSNLFGAVGDTTINSAGNFLIHNILSKIDANHQWWNNFISGILCNIIVVGATIISIVLKKNGTAAFIIYLMVVIFAMLGLQHIVANAFLFTLGGFLSLHESVENFSGSQVGELFYQNLIPTLFGNFFGGVALTMLYLSGQCYVCNNRNAKKQENETTKIEFGEEKSQN